MTAGNQLKAIISADISDLKSKLNQADGLLNQYRGNISRVQSAIGQNTQKSRQYEAQLQKLNQELKQGSISQEQFAKESDQLQNALLKTNRETRDFQRELDRLQKETTQLENGMENLTASTTDYARSTQRMGRSTRQMTGQVNTFGNTTRGNAVPAMQSFSQIIQDAPYGINGVANNIQQLTAQFGYLSTQSGGAKNAFKAMLATLTGPAGILLAVSAVTTVLVSYGDEILNAINGTDKFSKKMTEAAGSVQGELAVMQALLSVARDENEERQKRIDAITILNSKYPELNNQITLEKINTEATTKAIEEATKAIERRARMRAAESLVAEEAEKLFAKQVELERERGEAIQRSINARTQSYRKYSRGIGTAALDLEKLRNDVEERVNKEFDKRLENSEKKYRDYVGRLGNIIKNAPNLLDLFGEESNIVDEVQNQVDKEGPVRVKVEPVSTLTPSTGIIPTEEPDIAPISTEIKIEDNTDWEKLYENMERAQELGKVFANAIGASFSAVASEMAGALATGNKVIDAFVSTLLQGLAQMAAAWLKQQIMDTIITQTKIQAERAKSSANAITIATNQAAALGPFGFAALPGLIGSTLAIVNGAFAAAQGFAGGGIVGGGSFNGDKIPAFVNSGEMILNMGQQRELFNLLDGRMGSLQGNAQALKIQVEGVTRGEDIYWSQQRYTNNRSRRG